MLLLKLAGGGM